jgi:hypothetical protein
MALLCVVAGSCENTMHRTGSPAMHLFWSHTQLQTMRQETRVGVFQRHSSVLDDDGEQG